MNNVPDRQSEIFAQLKDLLGLVPLFGESVTEGSVLRLLDSEDPDLADDLIILQETSTTEEGARVPNASCKEVLSLSIVAATRRRDGLPDLRSARLAIKQVLKGHKAGLTVDGVISVRWEAETPMFPSEGRRWAARVIPIAITYAQPL
ncbi:hypothetical protein D9M69_456260 [compost metagenome]